MKSVNVYPGSNPAPALPSSVCVCIVGAWLTLLDLSHGDDRKTF